MSSPDGLAISKSKAETWSNIGITKRGVMLQGVNLLVVLHCSLLCQKGFFSLPGVCVFLIYLFPFCRFLCTALFSVRTVSFPQVNLRATDVKLMRQLLIINESIESIKWMIEEKAIASRGSSLSGSLCSLLESQDTSLQGSCNSLQDGSDGLDGISVGSYLDTLVDDVPGHQTPSDMDQFSDSSILEDSQPLHKHPKIDSDEYYCFG
nr:leucine rich adaptor protein 1-like [Dromaius novaehollandiae]